MWKDAVVKFEPALLTMLDFDLWCLHPVRPALLVVDAAQVLDADEVKPRLRKLVEEVCLACYEFGALTMLHAPAKLGVAVAVAAAQVLEQESPAKPANVADAVWEAAAECLEKPRSAVEKVLSALAVDAAAKLDIARSRRDARSALAKEAMDAVRTAADGVWAELAS